MSRRISDYGCWVLLAGMLLIALTVSGCRTQRHAYHGSMHTYASTMNILTDLRTAGEIDAESEAKINRWEPVAWAALQDWRSAIERGEQPPQDVLDRLERAMRIIRAVAIESQTEPRTITPPEQTP